MRVAHVSLKDFRNYVTAELPLEPGVNVLLGRNGQGKTNIAEAIMWFATLRSHRTAQDSALIRHGQEAAVARIRVTDGDRDVLLELQLNRSSPNRAQVNRHPVRPREFANMFSAVLFAPEDLSIVRGEPSVRRRFLDDALTLRYPVAAGILSDYERVLRQRNTLLKDLRRIRAGSQQRATLHVWNEQLVALGSQIIEHRRIIVNDLRAPLRRHYFHLVESDHGPEISVDESIAHVSRETTLEVDVSRETIASDFHRLLAEHEDREIERGQTLVGPHRDDLRMALNGLPVKGYASHGEMWSFALSLKLALAEILRADLPGGDPVLVLDDVFAELDVGRRQKLFSAVAAFEQVIVTAAVREDVPIGDDWNVVHIHNGEVLGGAAWENH